MNVGRAGGNAAWWRLGRDSVGCRVRSLGNGAEALAAAAVEPPALALLELQLPDVTGYELCRQFREANGDGLPVFLMSGDAGSWRKIATLVRER